VQSLDFDIVTCCGSVIDVLYHCGEENHWDLKETAFKAGWEAAVQNHKRVLQALQIAETKLEEIAKGRSWIGGRYSVSEMRTDEMQDIANDALAQIKDLK
jgi:hypothetical protein